MKKNKIGSLLLAIILVVSFVTPVIAAEDNTNLGSDYAVYLSGSGKQNDITLNMEDATLIQGNAIVSSGKYRVVRTWGSGNIVDGKLYPGLNVTMDTKNMNKWTIDAIKNLNMIKENADYSATLPDPEPKTAPSLDKKNLPNVTDGKLTITESGWYDKNITVWQGVNDLIFDTTGKEILRIHIKNLDVNGDIKIIGNGRVFLYVDNLLCQGASFINVAGKDVNQLIIVNLGSNTVNIRNSVDMVGTIIAPNSKVNLSGFVSLKGNVWAGNQVVLEGSSQITGLVYAPNSYVLIDGFSIIQGALVAKSLKLTGSSEVRKGNYSDFNLDDSETPPDPPDPPDPTADLHPGILGEYYDASEFTNESALRFKRIDESIAFNFDFGSPAPQIEPESFAIRWTGYIIPPKTGNYQFKTYSDDGTRVWVNNQKVIDNWGLYTLQFAIAPKTVLLEAGKAYPIKVEYQQCPIYAAMFLFWEAENVPMQLVPKSVLYVDDNTYNQFTQTKYFNAVSGTGSGLKNTFFDVDAEGGLIERSTQIGVVNYNWGTDAPEGVTGDAFRATMEGYIEPRFTEPLTLVFNIDDAVRVWIDDQLVLDEWKCHSDERVTCTIDAVVGQKRKIKIEYADFLISASCQMRWFSHSQEEQIVPAKFLYTTN